MPKLPAADASDVEWDDFTDISSWRAASVLPSVSASATA